MTNVRKEEAINREAVKQEAAEQEAVQQEEVQQEAAEQEITEQQKGGCACHQKATPRSEKELRQMKNRLSRMIGQLNGIGKMLDENRYCGDVLTQISAVESALQSFGYLVLRDHMETCVVEEISKGNGQIVEETVELIKKLK